MLNNCPTCGAQMLPEDQQPVVGTHAYTTVYKCGAEVIDIIGQDTDGPIWQVHCLKDIKDIIQ